METELTEKISYVNTFISDSPRNGIDSPHARIAAAIKLNEELAEYFKDRAQVEDAYAKSIAKLSKKHYITSKSALGTFSSLWEMLQMELSRLAIIHSEYATIITEEIEQPLRTTIQKNTDYASIQPLEEHLSKIAREFDILETKIQKYRKGTKGEAKALEYIKQQDQKLIEWKKDAPQFLQHYQNIDEARLDNLKSTVYKFETIQQAHAERVIELTGNGITAASSLRIDDEIAAFCASHTSMKPVQHLHPVESQVPPQVAPQVASQVVPMPPVAPVALIESIHEAPLIQVENTTPTAAAAAVVPEPTMSESSLKQSTPIPSYPPSIKKEKKRFFPSFTSIRRKPKAEQQTQEDLHADATSYRQRSLSHSESIVESVYSSSTTDQHQEQPHPIPQHSPNLQSSPALRNVASFSGSFTSTQPPLVRVDEEGYSIPPPDRAAWLGDTNLTNESLVNTEDANSDAGSMFSSPRIRVHIKNEASEEDASKSAVALTRVSTLLKESNSPTPRKLRGRREMRATQLYSTVEQNHLLTQINQEPTPLTNPFEMHVDAEPTMSVYITETVHMLLKGGIVEKSGIWGEISAEYDGPLTPETPVYFRLAHDQFEKLETTEFASREGTLIQLNTSMYSDKKRQVCVKYQTKVSQAPLNVKPMWKCDADKSRLLVKYRPEKPLTNVMFMTMVTGHVQNALSIPAGELVAQKAIKWHLGQVEQESVIKAQFTTLEQGTPQPVTIRFDMKDTLLSDMYVQQDNTKIARVTKLVKTGKYVAEME